MDRKFSKIVLAFMQNGWYGSPRNAARAQFHYDRVANDYKARERMTRYGVFAGCTTGRRLYDIYGEDLCDHILWENATTRCAGDLKPLPPEREHIKKAITFHKPEIVIAFGSCVGAIQDVLHETSSHGDHCGSLLARRLIISPHPVSRCKGSSLALEAAMLEVKRSLGL